MILAIRAKVLEWLHLAKALAEFPRAFPHLYRSTVAAGEHAGHFGHGIKSPCLTTRKRAKHPIKNQTGGHLSFAFDLGGLQA